MCSGIERPLSATSRYVGSWPGPPFREALRELPLRNLGDHAERLQSSAHAAGSSRPVAVIQAARRSPRQRLVSRYCGRSPWPDSEAKSPRRSFKDSLCQQALAACRTSAVRGGELALPTHTGLSHSAGADVRPARERGVADLPQRVCRARVFEALALARKLKFTTDPVPADAVVTRVHRAL